MLFFTYLLSLLAIFGLAAARKKPEQLKSWVIIHQLDILQQETQQLNTELILWDKSMLGAFNVSQQTEKLVLATKNAATTISTESKKLHIPGALHIKRNTKHLMKDIKTTVGHIGSLKEDFDKAGLAQTVLDSLIEQQKASQEMNDAIIPKLPMIGRGVGRSLGRKISKIFQFTIDEYKMMLEVDHALAPPRC